MKKLPKWKLDLMEQIITTPPQPDNDAPWSDICLERRYTRYIERKMKETLNDD